MATTEDFPDSPVLSETLSLKFLRDAHVLPIAETETSVTLAVANPADRYAADAVRLVAQKPVGLCVAAPEDLEAAILSGSIQANAAASRRLSRISIGASDDIVDESAEEDIERLKDLSSRGTGRAAGQQSHRRGDRPARLRYPHRTLP